MKAILETSGRFSGKHLLAATALSVAINIAGSGLASAAEITIESWRNDDLTIWLSLIHI